MTDYAEVLALHPRGEYIVTGGSKGTWKMPLIKTTNLNPTDLSNPEPSTQTTMPADAESIPGTKYLSAAAFDSLGSLAIASDRVQYWPSVGGRQRPIPLIATALAFIERGQLLLIGGATFLHNLWDVSRGVPLLVTEVGGIRDVVAIAVAADQRDVAVSHGGWRLQLSLFAYEKRLLMKRGSLGGLVVPSRVLPTRSLSFSATGRIC